MNEILFLAHRVPFPPNRGDKIRSHHIVRALAEIAPVHIACFADDEADAAEEGALAALAASHCMVRRAKPLALAGVEAMLRRLPVSLTAFHHPAIAAYVSRLLASGRIGAIFVFSGQMGQYVPADWPNRLDSRLIVDFVDVDSAKFEAYAAAKGRIAGWPISPYINAREARLLRAEEGRLAARADVSLLVSKEEAALFAARLAVEHARADVRALSNGIDAEAFAPGQVRADAGLAALQGPRLIFTGQMDYAPNVAAVERAARRILPLVRAQFPDASLHIVGRSPNAPVQALAALPGVHVWGRVPDVRNYLAGADIALVPLDIARGIQNKVLEAMAMALPVVLTPAAATGIDAEPGRHFAVAESDDELATAIVSLAQDRQRATAMGNAARAFVVGAMSWPQALAPLRAMLGETAGKPTERADAA